MNSLQRKGQIGGLVIIATLILAIAIASFSIHRIRFGGPLHADSEEMNTLNADILPPPLFIVEPFLAATLLADNDGSVAEHLRNLDGQRKDYEARRDFWLQEDLEENLRRDLEAVRKDGDHFWQVMEDQFIPAIKSGNRDRVEAVHAELGQIFREHRAGVYTLVKDVAAHKQDVDDSVESTLTLTIVLLCGIAVVVLGMIQYGLFYLRRQALAPLGETAEIMTRMAGGDLDAGRRDSHRGDEIGAMTKAIEVFRGASKAQREAEAKQRQVVESLSSALDQLAHGDLTHSIEKPLASEYEALRQSYNQTIARLGDLMRRVSESANSVSTGAGEIRAASDDLALRNEQQAASLEETAAAMNQVTGIVRDTAKGASDVQRSIAEAHREANEGGQVVRQAIEAMAAIERSSQEIGQIINVIDGIAFQTNLLALNAGVEAARAGDAGKGFAVVANEVRALAQRSADAAKDIKELITASTAQVSGGVGLVGDTGNLLEKIVTRVGEIAEAVTEIARSTENQSVNLQQVNSAVGDMDRMTQQNAAMVEESTAAARSLAEEARELTALVAQFRTS
ncbi:MAG: hypothetical protein RIQ46_544, partial [Pseudomonadota bacterium]